MKLSIGQIMALRISQKESCGLLYKQIVVENLVKYYKSNNNIPKEWKILMRKSSSLRKLESINTATEFIKDTVLRDWLRSVWVLHQQ